MPPSDTIANNKNKNATNNLNSQNKPSQQPDSLLDFGDLLTGSGGGGGGIQNQNSHQNNDNTQLNDMDILGLFGGNNNNTQQTQQQAQAQGQQQQRNTPTNMVTSPQNNNNNNNEIPPMIAYQKDGITIQFKFVKADKAGVCRIIAEFTNDNPFEISKFNLMIAVPKVFKI